MRVYGVITMEEKTLNLEKNLQEIETAINTAYPFMLTLAPEPKRGQNAFAMVIDGKIYKEYKTQLENEIKVYYMKYFKLPMAVTAEKIDRKLMKKEITVHYTYLI